MPAQGLPALRKLIDISGDGANKTGRRVSVARGAAVADGVVINGPLILNVESALDEHDPTLVIGEPCSLLIAIENYSRFAKAIVQKRVTEIADLGSFSSQTRRLGWGLCILFDVLAVI
jgi:hypothetical protein